MASDSQRPYGFFGLLWRMALVATIVFAVAGVVGYVAVRKAVVSEETTAPDLLTMEVAKAAQRASNEGFGVILEKSEPSSLVEEGHILAQRPSPGSFVKTGSTIRLTVATAP